MANRVIDTTPNAFFDRQAVAMAKDLAVVYRQLFREIFDIIDNSDTNELTPDQVREEIFELITGAEREPLGLEE